MGGRGGGETVRAAPGGPRSAEAGLPRRVQRFLHPFYKWASCGGRSRKHVDTQGEEAPTPAPPPQDRPGVTWGQSLSLRLLPTPCPASALGNSQQPHGPQPQAKLTPKQEEVISLPAELQLRLSSSRVFCLTGHAWARWEERDAASRKNEMGSGPRGVRAVLSSSAAGPRSSWGHPGSATRAHVQPALWAAPVPTPASSPGQDSAQRRSCSPKAGPRAACHSALLPGWSL